MNITRLQSTFYQPIVVTAAIVVILGGLRYASHFISPILFAFFLAVLLFPFVKKLQNRGVSRSLAITIISIISVLGLLGLIYYFYFSTHQLLEKAPEYQEQLAKQMANVTAFLNEHGVTIPQELPDDVMDGRTVIKTFVDIISNIVASSINLFFFFLTLILMLATAETFGDKLRKKYTTAGSLPDKISEWSTEVQRQFNIQTTNNLFTAILVGASYFLLGIDFAFLWTIVTFVFAYIPNIGIILSSIPPIVLAFIQYGPQTAVITLILIIILNQVMDSIVTPRMMGKGLQTPSLVVFMSFLLWTWVLGPLGAFLAMPFTLAIRSLFAQVSSTNFLAELLTEEDKSKGEGKNKK